MKAVRIARRVVVVRCEINCLYGGVMLSGSSFRTAPVRGHPCPASRGAARQYTRTVSRGAKAALYLGKSGAVGTSRRMSASSAGGVVK